MIDDYRQHVEFYSVKSCKYYHSCYYITLLCLDVDIIGPLKEKWREVTWIDQKLLKKFSLRCYNLLGLTAYISSEYFISVNSLECKFLDARTCFAENQVQILHLTNNNDVASELQNPDMLLQREGTQLFFPFSVWSHPYN